MKKNSNKKSIPVSNLSKSPSFIKKLKKLTQIHKEDKFKTRAP